MSSSPPSLFFSEPDFDELFPTDLAEPIVPDSNQDSDDLEALHLQEHEVTVDETKDCLVNRDRCWALDDVPKPKQTSTSQTPPDTGQPASAAVSPISATTEHRQNVMPFSSSPVLFPPSSSPPVIANKRRLFQTYDGTVSKKLRIHENVEGKVKEGGRCTVVSTVETVPQDLAFAMPATLSAGSPIDLHSSPPKAPSPDLPPLPQSFLRRLPLETTALVTSLGKELSIPRRRKATVVSYEQLVAQRSVVAEGRARKAFYGVDIHELLDHAAKENVLKAAQKEAEKDRQPVVSIEKAAPDSDCKSHVHQMWTEKYRARKFTDLVGDERTHRSVLKWLKAWDNIVFPGTVKVKPRRVFEDREGSFERQHRKILLLTGPPGLGKTTLAHVCARQAGYEVLEINASDDRSRDVVKGRIKDALGTENVRGIKEQGQARKAGRPVCVVVDEVDGVVSGSGAGGEGGFTKALVDLVLLDQKNASQPTNQHGNFRNKKAGDKFRLLRPLILICNDVYAPSLRPLRNSSFVEIVHARKAPLERVISRLKIVFEREQILAEKDALRRLCEHSWGLGSHKQSTGGSSGSGEGDIRSILVQGEWVAHKLRAALGTAPLKLTRKWVDAHLSTSDNSSDGKTLARGGVREVVDRIFREGAGLPNLLATDLSKEEQRLLKTSTRTPQGVAESRKRTTIVALREMVDTCGEHDRLMTDCFASYPTQAYQDDWNMSKANAGYEWLHFHDSLSSRIFGGQEWELNPYLSSSACGFHHLFAVVDKGASGWDKKENENGDKKEDEVHPFSGTRADFAAFEAEKEHRAVLTGFQASFSAPLLRLFSSTDAIAIDLIPNVTRMLAPEVKPVVVGGSGGLAGVASVRRDNERACIRRGVQVMSLLNVSFEKARVEVEGGGAHSKVGFAYRMEPPLDSLTSFHLGKVSGQAPAPIRYAIRQVLDQELQKERILLSSAAGRARSWHLESHVDTTDADKENAAAVIASKEAARLEKANTKRDFFGRIVNDARPTNGATRRPGSKDEKRVWVSFHEGYSNAVRKPITLKELMESFV